MLIDIQDLGDSKIRIISKCDLNSLVHEITIEGRDFDAVKEGVRKWRAGELIQNALPMLNEDEREFVLTGISPEMWDDMFGEPRMPLPIAKPLPEPE